MESKTKIETRRTASARAYYSKGQSYNISLPSFQETNLDLWQYYYSVPEIYQIGSAIGKAIGRVKFIPQLENGLSLHGSDGKPVLSEKITIAAQRLISRIKGPQGRQSEVNYQIGGALGIIGDSWLVGYYGDPITFQPKPQGKGKELWFGVSRDKIEIKNDQVTIYLGSQKNKKEKITLEDDFTLARGWVPQFANLKKADSWIRPLTRTLDQLLEAYEAMAAVVLSQINAGILAVPDDMDLPVISSKTIETNPEEAKERPDELADIIANYIIDAAENINGANRASPLVLPLPEDSREPKWIELGRQADPVLFETIQDLRKRIALASPFPPEQLLGASESKFYQGVHNVAQIDQDTFRYVYEPLCEIIGHLYTDFVLHPGLRELEFDEEEIEQIVVGWDATTLIRPQDKCKEALEMRQVDPTLISIAEVRQACGRTPDIFAPDQDQIPPEPNKTRQASAADTDPNEIFLSYARISQNYIEKLGVLCDQIVARMKERAGNRLLSKMNNPKYSEIYQTFKGIKPEHIGSLKDAEKFATNLHETNDTLFAPALEIFKTQFFALTNLAYDQRNNILNTQIGETVDPDIDLYNMELAYSYLKTHLIDYVREDFFGRLDHPEQQERHPASYKMNVAILAAISAIAGGATDTQKDIYSIATGPATQNVFLKNGYRQSGYIWVYGDPLTRKHPYIPHQELDGMFSATPFFGPENQYHVLDHYGCQCLLSQIYEKILET